MYQKTDTPEFAPGFVWQVCLLTAAVLGFVLLSVTLSQPPKQSAVDTSHTILFPWLLAGGHTLENGLLAFSGKKPEALNGKYQVKALSGLLLMSVVFPTVYFLNWRRRKLSATLSLGHESWKTSRVLYGFCGLLTIYFALAILPVTVISEVTRNRVRETQAVQSNRDAILNEINFVATDVAQFYVLPEEFGGGGGSLERFALPAEMSKTADATYRATPERGSVAILAVSTRYPNASLEMRIDSTGQMGEWTYHGEFQ